MKSKWDDLKIFIEYGIITDEKFAEKAADFVLLKNIEGKYFTLDEYSKLSRKTKPTKTAIRSICTRPTRKANTASSKPHAGKDTMCWK